MTFEELKKWRDAEAAKSTEEKFMYGLPESWYENLHWFCTKGHVSRRVLLCEEGYRDRCLACYEPVLLGPPIGEAEFSRRVK